MEAKAITRYLRVSPRKLRLVIDTVRYKPVTTAFAVLSTLKQKGAKLVAKTLKSAQANAKVKKMDENRLFIREIKADGGPSLKRYMPRSMGRADVILKRMSHLTVVLGEKELPVSAAKTDTQETKTKSKKIFGKPPALRADKPGGKKEKQAVGAGAK
ncbi:MAG: 50S ribosomal protein L22 [Candidatus Omnitrophica bacterium]|nr:50S ribosomal protein L22 [Candidatus Omnitrophota bacterium]